MSLLMQALRKAESAKKGQGAAAPAPEPAATPATPPGELTLESKEPTREDIATALEVAASAAPAAPPVDYFSSEVPPVRAPFVPVDPAVEPAPMGFDPDRGFSTAAPADPVPVPEPVALPPEAPPARPAATAARLKLGLEQQKEADSAAQKALEARNAASAVFAAKLGPGKRRPLVIAGLGLLVLAVAGGYGYYQFSRIGQTPPLAALPPVQAVPVPAAAPAVVAVPSAPVEAVATPAASAPRAVPAAVRSPGQRVSTPGPGAPRQAEPTRQADPARPAAPIEVRRNDASRQLDPTLSGAYQAFQAGDLNAARSQYQRMLQREPDNRDALLGMAAIAVNRGQASEAGSFYTRLLVLDPTDAEAASGLASVQGGDPTQAESNLKKVLAASPQTGSAHFALGNVYAQQQRWPEAQQAYFQAVGTSLGNPDYTFNLAVSLDKLGQKKLALDAYQKALQLAQRGVSNLNQVTVQARIGQLRQEMAAPPPK
jgi:Tfp pilus assembly protein PilF